MFFISAEYTPMRHEEAGGDEHDRVDAAEPDAELVAAGYERRIVPVAVEQIGEEQSTEEHDFGEQEKPHAEARGLALLLLGLEMVAQVRGMLVHRMTFSYAIPLLTVVWLSNGRYLLFVLFASHS